MESEPLRALRRWETSGGHWQVLSRSGGRLVVSLLTCTGGEEVDRLRSADPDLLGYVGDRESSEAADSSD